MAVPEERGRERERGARVAADHERPHDLARVVVRADDRRHDRRDEREHEQLQRPRAVKRRVPVPLRRRLACRRHRSPSLERAQRLSRYAGAATRPGAAAARERELDRLVRLLGPAGRPLGREALVPEARLQRGDELLVERHLDRRSASRRSPRAAPRTRRTAAPPAARVARGADHGPEALEALGGDALVAALLRELERVREELRRLGGSPPSRSATRPRFVSASDMLHVSPSSRASAKPSWRWRGRVLVVAARQLGAPEREHRVRDQPLVAELAAQRRGSARRARSRSASSPSSAASSARMLSEPDWTSLSPIDARQLERPAGELARALAVVFLVLAARHHEPADLLQRLRLEPRLARLRARARGSARRAASPAGSRPGRAPRSRRRSTPCRARPARRPSEARERLGQPAAALGHQAADAPEAHERAGEPQAELDLPGLERPGERGADVVVLLAEALEPDAPGPRGSARARPSRRAAT